MIMEDNGSLKRHLIQVFSFVCFIILFQVGFKNITSLIVKTDNEDHSSINAIEDYGLVLTIFLYIFRLLSILPLPLSIFHACGLIMYDVFPQNSPLRGSPLFAPFISVRIVTRGDFPELVCKNALRNMKVCLDLGLDKFMIEVVTDKALNIPKNTRIREIVVPVDYRSSTNCLYKSRALQYALEDGVNLLTDDDWIVHLDEETLLTQSSLCGILNFMFEKKHQIGQGLITYANEEVVNWVTTLADSFRVGSDMGMLRFSLRKLNKMLFTFKGSFVVCSAAVERDVTFDNGAVGSIAEDTFFALSAVNKGYTFDWIEGEMWEQSPFTFWDFLQQRKRWIQGIFLIVHDKTLPFSSRFCLAITLYSWLTMPLTTPNVFLFAVYPIYLPTIIEVLMCFVGAVNVYLYLIGAMKSFSLKRYGYFKYFVCVLGSVCTIPFVLVIENIAVVWALIGNKHNFYVVNKSKIIPSFQI